MATRKGMGRGKGQGYKNIIKGYDSKVHSDSGKGKKQPNKYPKLNKASLKYANMTMAEKKAVTKNLKLIDTDKDGVADVMDCQPYNKKKQDDMPVVEIEEIEADIDERISSPKLSKVKDVAKSAGRSIISNIKKLEKSGEKFLKERAEKAKLEELEEVERPIVKKYKAQKERVDELRRQIDSADDVDEVDQLSDELENEQRQFREIQEELTDIDVEDLSDKELKTLVVRGKGNEFSFFGSGNKYEDELVRRIRRKEELRRREVEVQSQEATELALLNERLKEERKQALKDAKRNDDGWF